MPVGGTGRPGAHGIDDHEGRPRFARRSDEGPQVQVGRQRVGAPQHDEPRVRELLGQQAGATAHGHCRTGVAGTPTHGPDELRRSQPGEERVTDCTALHEPLGSQVAVRHHGLGAVCRDDGREPGRDGFDRLVPADPHKLTGPFGPGTTHRVQEPVGVVDPVVEEPVDLGAQAAGGERMIGITCQRGRSTVPDRDRPRAGIGAIVRAGTSSTSVAARSAHPSNIGLRTAQRNATAALPRAPWSGAAIDLTRLRVQAVVGETSGCLLNRPWTTGRNHCGEVSPEVGARTCRESGVCEGTPHTAASGPCSSSITACACSSNDRMRWCDAETWATIP